MELRGSGKVCEEEKGLVHRWGEREERGNLVKKLVYLIGL